LRSRSTGGRRITIPRAVADLLGIEEGSRLRLHVEGDRVVLEPVRDALWFAMHGAGQGRPLVLHHSK